MTVLDLSLWEIVGAVLGLVCVWLAAKENVFTWPIGILSVVFYLKVFYDVKFYSDALLQAFFAIFQVYGWISWKRKQNNKSDLIKKLKPIEWLYTGLLTGIIWAGWYLLLVEIKPDAEQPILDSFTTVVSLVAVWYQARKYLDCWWMWIVADLVYIPLYLSQELYITAVLYGVFLFLAGYGFVQWKQKYNHNISKLLTQI